MESLLREDRVFAPPAEFAAGAHIKSMEEYEAIYRYSVEEPETFWAEAAGGLEWFAPWEKVLEGEMGSAKWFVGGKLNLCHNCVDRHALGARREKTALLWEGEPGEVRRISYGELHTQVQRFANALKGLRVRRGDRVAIYMGMCPELAIAMLACARIGAVHSVIFGGFAAQAIVDRVNDSECVAVVTQDVSYRRGAEIGLKAIVDEAMERCPTVRNVVVYQRRADPSLRETVRTKSTKMKAGTRPVVARPDGRGPGRLPGGVDGRRGPAVHPVYLGDDGEAEGAGAYDGRIRGAVHPDQQGASSTCARTMCTGARRTAGG